MTFCATACRDRNVSTFKRNRCHRIIYEFTTCYLGAVATLAIFCIKYSYSCAEERLGTIWWTCWVTDLIYVQLLLKFAWVPTAIDKLLAFQIIQGINQSVLESFLCVGIKLNYKLPGEILVKSLWDNDLSAICTYFLWSKINKVIDIILFTQL